MKKSDDKATDKAEVKAKEETGGTPALLENVFTWEVTRNVPECGYVKYKGVRGYPGARLKLTKKEGDALNELHPGCVTGLGL